MNETITPLPNGDFKVGQSNTYRSKPHEIQAFQFTLSKDYPDWFNDRVKIGQGSVIINKKQQCALVFGHGQTEEASVNDWVCLSRHGKMYVLKDEIFRNDYEVITRGGLK